MLSADRELSFFLICMLLLLLLAWLELPVLWWTRLMRTVILALLPSLRGKASWFSPLNMMSVVGFLRMLFLKLRKFPSIPNRVRGCIVTRCWVLPNVFLHQLRWLCALFSSVPLTCCIQFSSVQSLGRVQLFATPWTAHARLPCPSPAPGACSNSPPWSPWCHPTNLLYCTDWFLYFEPPCLLGVNLTRSR